MKLDNYIFAIILIFSRVLWADIVKTETFVRGKKTVYLLNDSHVSTDKAKLQAAEIEKALKETKDVKFLIQQVEPIFEADRRLSNCLDDLNEIKFIVEAKEDEELKVASEIKLKNLFDKNIVSGTANFREYLSLKKDDHSYGVAPFLDSSDSKKFYINHLKNWIRHSWRFFINEETFIEAVKKVNLKGIEVCLWKTLISNASLESFFYQYEVWTDLLENLSAQVESEKNNL